MHELRDVDERKVVIIYFREKSEKFSKNAVFPRFLQNVNLTFPMCYNKKEAMIFSNFVYVCTWIFMAVHLCIIGLSQSFPNNR